MENAKYVLHQPFNRQIKKMVQDGFPMAAATMDDWHQAVCDWHGAPVGEHGGHYTPLRLAYAECATGGGGEGDGGNGSGMKCR